MNKIYDNFTFAMRTITKKYKILCCLLMNTFIYWSFKLNLGTSNILNICYEYFCYVIARNCKVNIQINNINDIREYQMDVKFLSLSSERCLKLSKDNKIKLLQILENDWIVKKRNCKS